MDKYKHIITILLIILQLTSICSIGILISHKNLLAILAFMAFIIISILLQGWCVRHYPCIYTDDIIDAALAKRDLNG